MVDIAPIQTLDHEVSWEAEVLAHLNRLLIQNLGSEILRYAAVVYITELVLIILMVEQIINVDIVNIA